MTSSLPLPPGLYSCTLEPQPLSEQQTRTLSVSMTQLLVAAGLRGAVSPGAQGSSRLPIEPGLYPDQTELMLSSTHPTAELTVYGPTAALSGLEVDTATITYIHITNTLNITYAYTKHTHNT